MKNIMVTGGAGYIGSHTVRELLKKGFNVIVVDSLEAGHKEALDSGATLEVADVGNKQKMRAIFQRHEVDAVIDFAAYLAVGESMAKPKKYLDNNVMKFINLLDIMHEKKCAYIIKSSTAATYGNPPNEDDMPLKETYTEKANFLSSQLLPGKWAGKDVQGDEFFTKFIDEYQKAVADRPELILDEKDISKLKTPVSIYGLSKLLDEIILNKYDNTCGIKSVALRYFNVCGADPVGDIGEAKPKPTTLMTLAINQILGNIEELKIFGTDYETKDGTGVRDYIHPTDLAKGHIKALDYLKKKNSSDTFNLGTGSGSSVLEVLSSVEKASGKKVNTSKAPRRSGDPAVSVADPGKANDLLSWQAEFDLSDMAESAWKWHSTHPKGYKKD